MAVRFASMLKLVKTFFNETFSNEAFSLRDRNAPKKLELWKPGVYASREAVHLTPKDCGKSFKDVRIFDFRFKNIIIK